jgi:flagellar biosynthesis/type III secretory pathway protein FliH
MREQMFVKTRKTLAILLLVCFVVSLTVLVGSASTKDYKDGYAAGYQESYQEGYAAGYQDASHTTYQSDEPMGPGYETYSKDNAKGYHDGRHVGYKKGYNAGFKAGSRVNP